MKIDYISETILNCFFQDRVDCFQDLFQEIIEHEKEAKDDDRT